MIQVVKTRPVFCVCVFRTDFLLNVHGAEPCELTWERADQSSSEKLSGAETAAEFGRDVRFDPGTLLTAIVTCYVCRYIWPNLRRAERYLRVRFSSLALSSCLLVALKALINFLSLLPCRHLS